MEDNKEKILEINAEVGRLFNRAYKYLASAKPIMEDMINKNSESMNFGKVNVVTNELINEIFENIPVSEVVGKDRHLFGSAYTPNGWVEFTESILQDANKIYRIKGDYGTGKTTMLTKIYKEAISSGLDVEIYHTPLIPEKIETIWIKDLGMGITTSNSLKGNVFKTIDLDSFADNKLSTKYKENIEEDRKILKYLLDVGLSNIAKAKRFHDVMEEYYIPNMDFVKVNDVKDELVQRILKYDKDIE